MAPPFKRAEFDVMRKGISKVGEIIDIGVELNILKKSGSWFSYGEIRLGQGRDSIKNLYLTILNCVKNSKKKKSALIHPIRPRCYKTKTTTRLGRCLDARAPLFYNISKGMVKNRFL